MNDKKFTNHAATENNPRYAAFIGRESEQKAPCGETDCRTPFERDYTRILHCTAYRRLKHKTQVFYNIESDHICTRIEHVLHVESAAYTIANNLGLNADLTRAIAMGHDVGHAPFGHYGEKIISDLFKKYVGKKFRHENNGLYLVDNIELLPDRQDVYKNLDLTYAVRDGMLCHCGESDKNELLPREELCDLYTLGDFAEPATFEGCVVKLSDKIAYLGRDIEDAINLGFLTRENVKTLSETIELKKGESVNTGSIMSGFISDVCLSSSPEKGICLSRENSEKLNEIKKFNYKYIYGNERFAPFMRYAKLVLEEIFGALYSCYKSGSVAEGFSAAKEKYPVLISEFEDYVYKYCDDEFIKDNGIDLKRKYLNKKVYGSLKTEKVFAVAVLDFIAGMTDRYAVKSFNELITY